jgi:hypothetical protein
MVTGSVARARRAGNHRLDQPESPPIEASATCTQGPIVTSATPRWLRPAVDYGTLAAFFLVYLLHGLMAATAVVIVASVAALIAAWAIELQYGCDFVSAMPTNLYGPGDNFDLRSSHVMPAPMPRCTRRRWPVYRRLRSGALIDRDGCFFTSMIWRMRASTYSRFIATRRRSTLAAART